MPKTSLKTPFFTVTYSTKKLLSVDDENGISTLPLFTKAETAEKYRRYFARHFDLKLQVCIVDKLINGFNLLECASLACKDLQYVAIDPQPSPEDIKSKAVPIKTVIMSLLNRCRRQKGHNRQNLRKK
jgi:hypothetical protein